jgi:purine-binding chemotaxis protein CheW
MANELSTTKSDSLSVNAASNESIYQLVTFFLGEEVYGIDILSVQEIIRIQAITEVPRTSEFVLGVINLRGKVIPVIDLRKRFRLPVGEETKDTRIIVVEIDGKVMGMIVDGVSKVLRLPSKSVEPPSPIVSGIDSSYIKGVGKIDGMLIVLLDLSKINDSGTVIAAT